MEKL
ncbi:hypothetical protein VN97_g9720, partial [Penicillium thymicola]|jgi:GTPase SAR1 family protein